ncbi:Conserved hypothetical, protein [Geosmithia morbida]|uniref:Conserved hypothetical, protein n=1 Tax=Geosmithia morbida TaxID=1094350 RepID=A0A9P4YN43_9HYPO|nr:Conserved hypothetical, protein [Geosmithia morbida]KAF4120008.1 Conserved hypothetical, protein [Geosmithia morbida]
MADTPIKTDDGAAVAARKSSGYKSWKKKYRKMRIAFEQRMHDGDEIFKQEAKAIATVKRLAVENDRLLGLLLDINNCPQIPLERRINLRLSDASSSSPSPDSGNNDLDDLERELANQEADIKKLSDLLVDVPHMTYSATRDAMPDLCAELDNAADETYPAHFLSPDDVDNYLHVVDTRLDPDTHIPTLAPLAHPNDHPPLHPLLRNPNSSTSWLRRHAPQIFLQGHESVGGGAGAADANDNNDDEGASTVGGGPGGAAGLGASRKARGGARDRTKAGNKDSSAAARGKRGGAAAAAAAAAGDVASVVGDDTTTEANVTPAPKSKRKRDEDPGYRPKGGSNSRPSKKKRKSEAVSGAEGTPTVKRAKKASAAAAASNGDDTVP